MPDPHQPRTNEVAAFLTKLVQPYAEVTPNDKWQPEGFLNSGEARLGEAVALLNSVQRRALADWWLAVPRRANTPNWDIASTCRIDGIPGLVLVEAKAHLSELHIEGERRRQRTE